MNVLTQILIALRVALSTVRRRWWGSLNTVLGTATVVGMLVAILSIAAGYTEALQLAGATDRIMVMRAGSRSEMESSLTADQAQAIVSAASIGRTDAGEILAAPEAYAIASIGDRVTGKPMNVAVRGVRPASFELRDELRIVAGRTFDSGKREIIVGRRAQEYFSGLSIGSTFNFAGGPWTVVGVFESGGDLTESEIWADAPMVQAAYQRGDSVQVVIAKLARQSTLDDLTRELEKDPRLSVSTQSQADYYEEQSGALSAFVRTIGYGIAFLMGIGAVFAALNTGHAAVSARFKELATLSALGVDDRGLMGGVLAESIAHALVGGALGALIAWALFDGRLASTLFYSRDFSQVVFAFTVTGTVLAQAVLGAMLIGVLGGTGPALQIRRLPVARALAQRR
jgi:putative ABC transport system permease protein